MYLSVFKNITHIFSEVKTSILKYNKNKTSPELIHRLPRRFSKIKK